LKRKKEKVEESKQFTARSEKEAAIQFYELMKAPLPAIYKDDSYYKFHRRANDIYIRFTDWYSRATANSDPNTMNSEEKEARCKFALEKFLDYANQPKKSYMLSEPPIYYVPSSFKIKSKTMIMPFTKADL